MKKHIFPLILLAAAGFGVTSCSDSFLDTSNPNQPSSTSFWSTEDDALMALTACYDAFQAGNLYNDNIDGWKFGFLARETCTDNGDHSWGNWMLGSSIAECSSGTNDECFSMYWNANYELIKRCNMLIDNIDRVPMDQDKIDAFRAEAIAIRALGYCNLVSVFRDVPYLTHTLTLAEAKAPKTDKKTIVDGVIADLKANLPKMPVKADAQKGRLSREGGYAILGRIALFDKRYDEAIEAYKQVYGKYTLFKSGDGTDYYRNYADLFTEGSEYADEVILGVHYVGPAQGEGQTFGVKWGAPMNAIEASMDLCDEYYCTDGKPITESPLFNNVATTDPARYENRDPRLKGTCFVSGMTWNGTLYDFVNASFAASSKVAIRKWYTPEDITHEYDGSQDFYVIRYAEVLLSYAEALIEKNGNDATAISCIDEVRARVGMPSVANAEGTGLSKDRLREIVRHERRVELAFEDLRFADIYRWGDFAGMQTRMRNARATYGGGVLNHLAPRGAQDNVWPIPQGEIDTNDMLVQHDEWK
ncbi:MAG: RagB/SusD family nutrient uptake outer membrane protein [Muribaculaceae bacterium]|nr:RagB/SusD family nutrient uptake outer membrane protein [Muribaculaceae bacterium]